MDLDVLQKIEVLKEAYSDQSELDQILGKLLAVTLGEYRRRFERYEREMREFESRYKMDSTSFYQRFESGELGDGMDLFEWAGLYELKEDLQEKIRHLETAL
jgi:hypothetical protein